jgi:hypothetical protein
MAKGKKREPRGLCLGTKKSPTGAALLGRKISILSLGLNMGGRKSLRSIPPNSTDYSSSVKVIVWSLTLLLTRGKLVNW